MGIAKPIEQITVGDIESLVTDAIREDKRIEYKQELPGSSDGQRKEFLADVSSFANASGGDIVYGVKETRDDAGKPTGIPEKVTGLLRINADREVIRIEQMIRSGVEPRIPGIEICAIDGFPSGPVIVLRVPQSWSSPHMVSFKSKPRFFTRTSAGKSPLDVPEIRAAFLQSEAIPEKIRRFREDRLGQIIAGETPVPMPRSPCVVLHMIPLSAFLKEDQVDPLLFLDGRIHFTPLGRAGGMGRLNIDGYVSYQSPQDAPNEAFSYAQIFRNSAIEAADTYLLVDRGERQNVIPSIQIERDLIDATKTYVKAFKSIDVDAPIIVMLSLLDVRGFQMYTGERLWCHDFHPIDRQHLLVPDVTIEDLNNDVETSLRPVFDLLWQACGVRRSYNYGEDGKWNPR